MAAQGKITASAIARSLDKGEQVSVLVTDHKYGKGEVSADAGPDSTWYALNRKTVKGPNGVAATVHSYITDRRPGDGMQHYVFTTNLGTIDHAPGAQTFWLATPTEPASPASPLAGAELDPDAATTVTTNGGVVVAVAQHVTTPDTAEREPAWTERFSAGWSGGEVTVIRDIRGGICGPFGEYQAADLAEAERVLRANGYALSGPWAEHTNGHFAPLVCVSADQADDVAQADPNAARIAELEAELKTAEAAAQANFEHTPGGRSRTKRFGKRVDAQLKRAGQHRRNIERIQRELAALNRQANQPAPVVLDLARLPHAYAIRTDTGWYRVLKVNRVTVQVEVPPGWNDLIKISKVLEIRERATTVDDTSAEQPAVEPDPFAVGEVETFDVDEWQGLADELGVQA